MSVPDRAPKKFLFQRERLVKWGRIETIEVDIYTCEERDTGGIKEPKYPDDAGMTSKTTTSGGSAYSLEISRCQEVCRF